LARIGPKESMLRSAAFYLITNLLQILPSDLGLSKPCFSVYPPLYNINH
jgi:hypothetical protein